MTAAHAEAVPGIGAVMRGAAPPASAPRPARRLRLAPPPPRPAPGRGDAVYALALAVVLLAGVMGVLMLNTFMQQQARAIDAQRAQLARLALAQQNVQLTLDAAASPRTLAQRAAALHMRPAPVLEPLTAAPRAATHPRAKTGTAASAGRKPVSARGPAASPSRAG